MASPLCPFCDLTFLGAVDEEMGFTVGKLNVDVVWVRILDPRASVDDVFLFVHEGNVRVTKRPVPLPA